jgi:hypothetical protein
LGGDPPVGGEPATAVARVNLMPCQKPVLSVFEYRLIRMKVNQRYETHIRHYNYL